MADGKTIDDGGPAFARPGFYDSSGPSGIDCHPEDGMSLRDWFAGQALPQFIMINEHVTVGRDDVTYAQALAVTASQSYAIADAMIAARKGGA
ncbi:hypothetical protein RHSP_82935 [Rhizobium freirei PRF 81]|uniref:Uncharacterized protein n=1 Tax=Rhizobium freirei PRF 81 TaxID=363754 RepID=N6U718_9HYPH|nr:hypothetical protein [Rhizobium freirei]ENN86033.1 hypothetical protein RHSP_82935 [Rhizobium freirei PRF 81]